MNYFKTHARMLMGNGYLLVPIKQGHKRPIISAWQNARISASDVDKYSQCGVGVLTGQGDYPLAAIDIDTLNPQVAKAYVTWLTDNLGLTIERVGKAPKILLVYRTEKPINKLTSAWFTDGENQQRVEILGKGQQFVALHTHPETGKPYEWVDFLGGIEEVQASDLPTVTVAQLQDALAAFERIALEHGLTKQAGSSSTVVSTVSSDDDIFGDLPTDTTLDQARELLSYLDPYDYDQWVKCGMAMHHQFSGSDEALAVWDEWSANAENYRDSNDTMHRWGTFGGHGVTMRTIIKLANQAKRNSERDDRREALAKARTLIADCSDSFALVEDVAPKIGKLVGSDKTMRPEVEALLRNKYKKLTKATLAVADVRKALDGNTFAYAPGDKRSLTEFGNAERMLERHGHGLLFVPEVNSWYRWNGVHWQKAMMVDLEHLAKDTIRAMYDEGKDLDDAQRADFYNHCAVSQKASMVKNMIVLAQSDPRVVVSVSELDKNKNLLGVGNGTVDLTTGELLEADPDDNITVITKVEYDPNAKAPLFEKTVSEVFEGDAEMVQFFQRIIGYTLLGQPNEDIFIIPFGSGSNGKSTLLGAIRDVLGSHSVTAEAATFLGKNSASAGGAREDVLRLMNKRFVYITEPDEGSELKEGLVKAMTGGEAIPARGLYSRATVEVLPTWVAFMPTNHKPIVKGDDHGIWRRLVTVPFLRNFDNDENVSKDPNRAEKLAAESQGVLTWCVQGTLQYLEKGLAMPAKVIAARDEYKEDMDLLGEFIDDCCEVGEGNYVLSKDLWHAWERFARERGELFYIRSARALGKRMVAKGFRKFQHEFGLRGRGFVGIKLKESADKSDFE